MIDRSFKILSLVFLLASCAAGGSQEVADAAITECAEQRPQLCTSDYRPVCAVLADGRRQEFSNGCSACSNPEVSGWIANTCKN